MGSQSQSPLKLPKIDFSGLEPGTDNWASVVDQVQRALETYGSFEAKYDEFPTELRQAIFDALRELFALPVETKVKNYSAKAFHGYVGQYPDIPLYESLGIEDADKEEAVKKFAHLMWPQGNPGFSETIRSFANSIKKLDHLVKRMVLESLGVMKYYESQLDSTYYVVRVTKYNAPNTMDPQNGLTAHTDVDIVSILYQNNDGLQVQTKDGDWIPVAASPDSFVVMVGDTFSAWTNGRVHPPYHRVVMTGDKDRYSVGLFSNQKAGRIVEAPEELVDEDHPLLFKPFYFDEFLKFFSSEEGRRANSALTAYCGANS